MTGMTYRQQGLTGAPLAEFGGLLYDGAGNRTQLSASLSGLAGYGGTTLYTYDNKSQLTSETSNRVGGYGFNFAYDAVGNLTLFKGVAGSYNPANQNTQNGTVNFDGNGNPATVNGVAVTWDPNDRATNFGALLSADYSGSQRAWKQSGTNRTYIMERHPSAKWTPTATCWRSTPGAPMG